MKTYTRDQLFSEAPIGIAMKELVLPTIIGQLMTMIYNLTDTFFVGKTGDPLQVAAIALTFPIYHLINAIGNLFGIGGGSLISRLLGKGDKENVKFASSFSFWAAIAVTSVYSILVFAFLKPVMVSAGASDLTLKYCSDYMLWVAVIGGVPTIISLIMAHLLRSDGYGAAAGRGMIIGNVANIALDPVFVLALNMGVKGAAAATMIANVISCLYYYVVYTRIKSSTRLNFSLRLFLWNPQIVGQVMKVGIPSALYVTTSSLANVVFNKLLSGFGDIIVASAGVAKKVDTLPLNVCMGISHGTIPLLAFNYSSGNVKRLKKFFAAALFSSIGVCTLCIILFIWKSESVIRFFIDDAETVAYGAKYLKLLIVATPLMSVNIITNSLFQATGKGKESVILSLSRQGLVYIPVMLLLSYLIGPTGIVGAQLVADAITMIISFTMYCSFINSIKQESLALKTEKLSD